MIKIKKPSDCIESEITPESLYLKRRQFIKSASLMGVAGLTLQSLPITLLAKELTYSKANVDKYPLGEDDKITDYEDATSYNNFYEFGTGKSDPAINAKNFDTDGWKVKVSGACENPGEFSLEDLISGVGVEERIYRLRCVEAWSMVIPWQGVELGKLLKKYKPTSNARYVVFKTLLDPQRMPGQKWGVLDWPYVEGLRIDEAMNPLSILAIGMYGKTMPGQNGAPIRLVVPWKYGFKSIKSIVSIEFTEQQPETTWHIQGPNEYGFYANVNPEVDHPRWSQARERRIGDFFKRKTLMFNGYAEEVASLYSGMDLRKNF
jgi:methionine sulfoxide reductase catalytic subunit